MTKLKKMYSFTAEIRLLEQSIRFKTDGEITTTTSARFRVINQALRVFIP